MPYPNDNSPRVLVVGNYPADRQESMLRFARMLTEGAANPDWPVDIVAPRSVFGGHGEQATHSGIGKWLAYLDKYVIFPLVLRWRVRRLSPGSVVHIADHSNALYASAAKSAGHAVLVTCHDLGAVRGALGEATDCPASRFGRVLQAAIRRTLGQADAIACVSSATQADVERLVRRPDGRAPVTRVVPLGLNASFRPLPGLEASARLAAAIPALAEGAPFVLHVGSGLRRKNREGVVQIFARVSGERPTLRLVFAGEPPSAELRDLAASLGVSDRIVPVPHATHEVLEALYSRAVALLYPSTFEGFGWPVIEAQACGCPVLCADGGALAEVAGKGAFVRPATDEEDFAQELRRILQDPAARGEWVAAGFRNLTRFSATEMRRRYADLYEELSGRKRAGSVVRAIAPDATTAASITR